MYTAKIARLTEPDPSAGCFYRRWLYVLLAAAGILAPAGIAVGQLSERPPVKPAATSDSLPRGEAPQLAAEPVLESPRQDSTVSADDKSTNPNPAQAAPRVRAVGPDIYYLRDKNGNPVPVPAGMTIQDFQRLYRIDQQLTKPAVPPRYALEETNIRGTVVDDRARLSIRISIRVLVDGPVRIPLGMANVIPRKIPQGDTQRQITIRYEESSGGYVAWMEAIKDSVQELALDVIVPIRRNANQCTLNLETPRATVSEMELIVPEANPTVTVSDNGQLLEAKELETGGTFLRLAGVSGVLRLAWSEPPEGTGQASSLEVDSTLIARFGGPDAMRTEGTFRIQSLGQAVDVVRIRLPPDAQVIATSASPYQATVEEADDPRAPRVAVFQLPEPTRERFTVQLVVEQRQPASTDGSRAPLSAGAFFVEGAFRHVGHLALAIEGDWLPRWDDSLDVRPTADIPLELQSETQATVFRYYEQPFELPLTIVRKQTRTSVVPTYVLDVQPDRVELRALLQVTVHGAPTQSLQVELPGWEVYDVMDTVPIQNDELLLQESPLRIPFTRPRHGRFDIDIRARRKVQPTDTKLTMSLPRILNASSHQATVVAQPADNVELNLLTEETSQLLPARLPSELTLPTSEQSPLCHRVVDSASDTQVVYRFKLKPQLIHASVISEIEISSNTANIEQQFMLDIRNAPLDRIILRVPEQLPVESLEFYVDGNKITAKSDPELATALAAQAEVTGGNADYSYPVFELPFGEFGDLTAKVSYTLGPPNIATPTLTEWDLRLTLPEVDQIDSHEAIVRGPQETSLRSDDTRWLPVDNGRRRDRPPHLLVVMAEGDVDSLAVQVTAMSDDEVSSTSIRQAFVQTWATALGRRDRAIFRFTSTETSLRLKVPERIRRGQFVAMLDKVLLNPTWINDAIVEFDLSNVPIGEHVLEVSYGFEDSLGAYQNLIDLPTVEGSNWTQEFFWQLVLPARTHLIREPTGLIPANHWGWHGVAWGRTPKHEQPWLESWVGGSMVSRQAPPQPNATNRYLFTTFNEVDQLQIVVARRTVIALVLTGLAFVATYLFVSYTWMRRPFVILFTLFMCAFLAFAAPVPLLSLLPAFLFGLCLALTVPLLKRVIYRHARRMTVPARPRPIRQGPSTSISSLSSFGDPSRKAEPNATTAAIQVPQDA